MRKRVACCLPSLLLLLLSPRQLTNCPLTRLPSPRAMLEQAMEQQSISISKAGIVTQLQVCLP